MDKATARGKGGEAPALAERFTASLKNIRRGSEY
jgi:hypothetical protein